MAKVSFLFFVLFRVILFWYDFSAQLFSKLPTYMEFLRGYELRCKMKPRVAYLYLFLFQLQKNPDIILAIRSPFDFSELRKTQRSGDFQGQKL